MNSPSQVNEPHFSADLPKTTGKPMVSDQTRTLGICALLVAIVALVFGQTVRFEFVNYDDGLYVNEKVGGLTLDGIRKAFTRGSADNWDPLTTLSHMLDYQLYGMNAWGHHLTNVLLHTATAILLFLVLGKMRRVRRTHADDTAPTQFDTLWPCAFVAAVFAIHPLRVESVAWVAERKDVLSGLFFMLTLWAYAKYADTCRSRREGSSRLLQSTDAKPPHVGFDKWYVITLLLFTLGLMSKPMLVTLPFVLLLLDYWPLERFTIHDLRSTIGRLIREKVPFAVLSFAFCVVTLLVQMPAMTKVAPIPLSFRIGNAIVAYATYVGQMFFPTHLAVFYPFPTKGWPPWEIGCAALLLLIVSVVAVGLWRKRPYLTTGWFWYLGMLVPVIGFVQVGFQARADRYTYLPQIGLYVALTWLVMEISNSVKWRSQLRAGLAVGIVTTLSVLSFIQTSHWRNSESLWTHTLASTSNNATAHSNLGTVLVEKGELEKAIEQFHQAIVIQPDHAPSHNNLGAALLHNGKLDEAIDHFRKSIAIQPDYAEAHDNLGIALSQVGQVDESLIHFQKALEIRPDDAEAHYNLAIVLSMNARIDDAIVHFQKSLALEPKDAAAHANLASALAKAGRIREAILHFQYSLTLQPDNADTCRQFAWILATSSDASIRNGLKAVELAEHAVQVSNPADLPMLGTLAAAYAEAGRFNDAIEVGRHALQIAEAQQNSPVAEAIARRIKLYEAGVPFREAGATNAPLDSK